MRWLTAALALCASLFFVPAFAAEVDQPGTFLEDLRPHPPQKAPWSDAWYYYIHDPDVGYFKITFLHYLTETSALDEKNAYVHVVYAPKDGEEKVFDYFYDDFTAEATETSEHGFRFAIPDVAEITESEIRLTLPDLTLTAQISDQHTRYFDRAKDDNPGRSPFRQLSELPFLENQWFIYSLGTPATYEYQDNEVHHQGGGMTYIDRGWNSGQAASFAYVIATGEDTKLMLTGGYDGNFPLEIWVGRLKTAKRNINLPPRIKGLSVFTDIDPCAGTGEIFIGNFKDQFRVKVKAPVDSFYYHTTPSVTAFNSEHPPFKSMNAKIEIQVYQYFFPVEKIEIDQGLFEFGGALHCADPAAVQD